MSNTAAIMQHWFGPPNRYPDDYIFIDVETTGRMFGLDVITEVGWAIVRNRRVVDFGGQLLNWASYFDAASRAACCQRLQECAAGMAAKGRTLYTTPERLQAEGMPPVTALNMYADILEGEIQRGQLVIGHNAWFFDRQMIDSNLLRFCSGRRLPWHPNAIFDTGLVERASQMRRLPWVGDTLDKWQGRAAAYPFNTQWNLDTHCVQKYRLGERFNVDPAQLHQAGFDCITGHLLFETFREIGEGRYIDPAPYPAQ